MKHLAQRADVERGRPSITRQQPVGPQRSQHVLDVDVGEWRDSDGDVPQHLDQRATQTDHDERPEQGVVVDTHDHLPSRLDLLLHEELGGHPGDPGRFQVGANRPHRICGCSWGGHPEPEAADIALVDRGGDFDGYRAPELDLSRLGFGRGAYAHSSDHRDAIRAEQRLGVERVQPTVARASAGRGGHEATNPEGVDVGSKHLAGRATQPVLPCDAPAEGACSVLRERERRDARLTKSWRRALPVQEHRDQRDVPAELSTRFDELGCHIGGPSEQGCVEHDDQSVDLRCSPEDSDRLAVLLRGGAGDHVDRVGHARLRWEQGPQTRSGELSELGHDEPVGLAGICGKNSRPAPVGQNGHSASWEPPLRAQHCGEVEHLLDGFGADDARLVEQGVHCHVAAGERCSVRSRRSAAGFGPACLHRHDGDPPADPSGDSDEPPRVLDLLQIEQDQVGGGVLAPVKEQVVAGNVRTVAHRDERADPEATSLRRLQHGEPNCA